MAKAINVDISNFEEKVINSGNPTLVDFWAPWCGPCVAMAPVMDELAADFEGKATIAKVNVDENKDLAVKYGVRSIPNMVLFKNGKEVDRIIGSTAKSALAQKIDSQVKETA